MLKWINMGMIAAGWFMRACRDGRITAGELVELGAELIGVGGLDLEIDVADFNDPNVTLPVRPPRDA